MPGPRTWDRGPRTGESRPISDRCSSLRKARCVSSCSATQPIARRSGATTPAPAAAAGARCHAPTAAAGAVSAARIARLKRFDLSWRAALDALDTSKFSTAARADLESLRATIVSNQAQLDAQSLILESLAPVVPFAPALVDLIEARIRLQDVDSQAAAGVLTRVTREIAARQAALEAGLAGSAPGAIRVNPARTRRRAPVRRSFCAATSPAGSTSTTATTRCSRGGWGCRSSRWTRRSRSTPCSCAIGWHPAHLSAGFVAPLKPIAPAPAPKYSEVPDLREIIALSQDEMTQIVAGVLRSGRPGGRGGRGGAPRDLAFYRDWLTALKSLDFDKLSRNAQVDYLVIRRTAEAAACARDHVAAAQSAAQGRQQRHPRRRRADARGCCRTCRTPGSRTRPSSSSRSPNASSPGATRRC